jgi:soluble lytic murein transglycosylase-like protein
MARLSFIVVIAALSLSSPLRAESVARWQSHISEASQRFGIPEDWIMRVMRVESGGRTTRNGKPIRSRVGAMGLMQIMPATWSGLTARYSLGSNPDDPHANIFGGTAYLREMYDLFGYPGLFAAYNAGPGRYSSYRAGRSRLPSETIAYVTRITGNRPSPPIAPAMAAEEGVKIAASSQPPTLFFVTRAAPNAPAAERPASAGTALFAIQKSPAAGGQ